MLNNTMVTFFRRAFTSGIFGLLVSVMLVTPALASIGNQNPNLTVQLTITPTIITSPNQVTASASITNNTKKTDRVTANVEIVSPKGTATTYTEKYTIQAGKTVSKTVIYTVAADAEKGLYKITLLATDKTGSTSWATEYLTVE